MIRRQGCTTWSRYYNPTWGRFINADSLVKGNLYCYCGNNPIRYFDDGGNSFWDTIKRIGEAAIVIAAVIVVGAVIIGTGGGAGFALAGGATIAATSISQSALTTAAVIGSARITVYAISESAQKTNEEIKASRQHKGTPRNNQSQNRMFNEAVRQLRSNGIKMTPDRINRFHRAVSHFNYSLDELIEEGMSLFGQ